MHQKLCQMAQHDLLQGQPTGIASAAQSTNAHKERDLERSRSISAMWSTDGDLPLLLQLSSSTMVTPHLRQLSDSRTALVMSDSGGLTLQQLVHANLLQQLPPAPQQSPPLHSPDSVSSVSSQQSLSFPLSAPKSFTNTSGSALVSVTSVAAALRATLCLARPLLLLHRHSFVHKALHPSTLALNPLTGEVQFLDLSSASLLVKNKTEPEAAGLHIHLQQVSEWVYAAPELSGKANRVIDSRSDLYSVSSSGHQLLGSAAYLTPRLTRSAHANALCFSSCANSWVASFSAWSVEESLWCLEQSNR